MRQNYKAFTLDHIGLAKSLQTPCGICEGISVDDLNRGVKHPLITQVTAIWDTGAEMSSISEKVVLSMGLVPVGRARNYTDGGEIEVNIYVINILLPCDVNFAMIPVTGNDLGDTDMLIGMDIISQGDFAVTNVGGKTTLSFRIPSIERIDYVNPSLASSTVNKPITMAQTNKIGRNDPCPCGSGKKYKNCHGKV